MEIFLKVDDPPRQLNLVIQPIQKQIPHRVTQIRFNYMHPNKTTALTAMKDAKMKQPNRT